MAIKDGGPAFPCDSTQKQYPTQEGMSLRDWFAGQALAGIMAAHADNSIAASFSDGIDSCSIARIAYAAADFMLAEREVDRD